MKYTPYSHSKINTWQQCPRKFKYQYIDKLKIDRIPKFHFDKGKFIHLLLEYNGDINRIKNTEDFKEIRKNNILTKDDLRDFINIYKEFISSKAGYAITSKTELLKEFALGLDKDCKIVQYDGEDVFLRGYIDAVYVDEKSNTLLLVDWKTGKIPPKTSFQQILFYAIGLFDKMPYDKILLVYAYIEHNTNRHKIIERKDIEKYKKVLYVITHKIESDDKFEKCENEGQGGLCDYCDFQNICLMDG